MVEAAWSPRSGERPARSEDRQCLTPASPGPAPARGLSWGHTQGPPGCLQVNWSQPPWLVNNHRRPQRQWHRRGPAWLREEQGWTPCPTAATSAPAQGDHTAMAELTARTRVPIWGGWDCPWGDHRAIILLPWLLAATNPQPSRQCWPDLCTVYPDVPSLAPPGDSRQEHGAAGEQDRSPLSAPSFLSCRSWQQHAADRPDGGLSEASRPDAKRPPTHKAVSLLRISH